MRKIVLDTNCSLYRHESSFPYDSKKFASISFSLAEMKMAVNTKLRIYRLNHLLRGVKKLCR